MINIEDLREITNELYNYKSIKKIKVTTDFAYCLDRMIEPLPHYEPNKFYSGMFCEYQGIPIEIDDEIDGLYEIVY